MTREIERLASLAQHLGRSRKLAGSRSAGTWHVRQDIAWLRAVSFLSDPFPFPSLSYARQFGWKTPRRPSNRRPARKRGEKRAATSRNAGSLRVTGVVSGLGFVLAIVNAPIARFSIVSLINFEGSALLSFSLSLSRLKPRDSSKIGNSADEFSLPD